jgi:hypothetical protein
MKLFKMELTNVNQIENVTKMNEITSVRLNELIKKIKNCF